MRVNFGNGEKQIEFFKKVKPSYISWREFYKSINENLKRKLCRRTYRNWQEGKRLPPLDIIKIICKIFGYNLENFHAKIMPENWGKILGGKRKSELYECNLTKEQRIEGGKKSMKLLRQRFGQEKMKEWSSYAGSISVKNSKRYKRKVIGPKGEKMFNELEKEVAEILLKLGISYEYEKILKIKDRYIVPDFIINQLLIECTYFSNVEQKSQKLKEKFNVILNETSMDRILVITREKVKSEYNKLLGNMADVLTPQELPEWFITQS